MSKYTERLQREYKKLEATLDGIESTDPLLLNAVEIDLTKHWSYLFSKAKTDEQKEIIADATKLFQAALERQRKKVTE